MTGRQPQVVRHRNREELADTTARRLLATVTELQRDGGVAHLCLTGGRIATAMYAQLGELLADSEVDSSRLELWWGDERFLPTEDPERNAGPTLALLARYFQVDPARTHPMPSADGVVDAGASANTYAKELGETRFDVCLLGMGPDGHVASIFPNHPSSEPTTQPVIGVSDAPKPPSERISLTLATLSRSRQVWFLVSGEEKGDSLARALGGDPELPASRVEGTDCTLWLVDEDAAGKLPYFDCWA